MHSCIQFIHMIFWMEKRYKWGSSGFDIVFITSYLYQWFTQNNR